MPKRIVRSDGYLTVIQTAAILKTSRRWVYKLLKAGKLTPVVQPVGGASLRMQVTIDEREVSRYVSDARSKSAVDIALAAQLGKGKR